MNTTNKSSVVKQTLMLARLTEESRIRFDMAEVFISRSDAILNRIESFSLKQNIVSWHVRWDLKSGLLFIIQDDASSGTVLHAVMVTKEEFPSLFDEERIRANDKSLHDEINQLAGPLNFSDFAGYLGYSNQVEEIVMRCKEWEEFNPTLTLSFETKPHREYDKSSKRLSDEKLDNLKGNIDKTKMKKMSPTALRRKQCATVQYLLARAKRMVFHMQNTADA